MHPYLVIYLILVGTGLAGAFMIVLKTGNRKHPILKKSLFYIPIASLILLSVIYRFFPWLLLIILLGIWTELLRIMFRKGSLLWVNFLFIGLFAIISYGLFSFSLLASQDQLLFMILVAFTFDAFSQITGQLAGKYKITTRISPNKTLEGFAGGMVFSLLAVMLANYWMNQPWLPIMIMAIGTALAAFAGDLLASMMKRINDIKDFSNWLPGQGGFLDRFDSLVFAGFFLWILYLLELILPAS